MCKFKKTYKMLKINQALDENNRSLVIKTCVLFQIKIKLLRYETVSQLDDLKTTIP